MKHLLLFSIITLMIGMGFIVEEGRMRETNRIGRANVSSNATLADDECTDQSYLIGRYPHHELICGEAIAQL